MTTPDDPIEMEFIGAEACPKPYPHYSHDWFTFNNREGKIRAYRCDGGHDDAS